MITPDEITVAKTASFDPEVIQAVDTLLAERWTGSRAFFKQDEVVDLILKMKGFTDKDSQGYQNYRHSLFDRHQLDFEDHYRDLGWSVSFDKPAYNESYDANWTFKREDPDSPRALKREIVKLNKVIARLLAAG